jgi:hypothetical protein
LLLIWVELIFTYSFTNSYPEHFKLLVFLNEADEYFIWVFILVIKLKQQALVLRRPDFD